MFTESKPYGYEQLAWPQLWSVPSQSKWLRQLDVTCVNVCSHRDCCEHVKSMVSLRTT